jgi:hypothetical protein
MLPQTYVIHVDGELPAHELEELVGMAGTVGDGVTVLRGEIRDQSALLGLVARVEEAGCSVRDLQVLPVDEEATS